MPCTVISGRCCCKRAEMSPSPQPTSSTRTPDGSILANQLARTLTRRFETSLVWRTPTAEALKVSDFVWEAKWIVDDRRGVLSSLHQTMGLTSLDGMQGRIGRVAGRVSSQIRRYPQLTTTGRCGIMGASIAVLPLTGTDTEIGGNICRNSFAGFGRKIRGRISRSMR